MNIYKLAIAGTIAGVLLGGVAFELRHHTAQAPIPSSQPLHQIETVPPPQPQPPVVAASQVAPVTWKAKFRSTDDYLLFVREAVPAAMAGDGRAAWYVGRAVHECVLVMSMYHNSPDAEAQLQQELTNMRQSLPQSARDDHERQVRRCLGLAEEGAPGGYGSDYWAARALEAGDPLAQTDAAARALTDVWVDSQMRAEVKADKLKTARKYLQAAVESGDPDALYQVGFLFANPKASDDALRGMAVALASCDLGHDCSAANPDYFLRECITAGNCPPNADFQQSLQQSLGQEGYAALYARAQQIAQLARAGDQRAVLTYLTRGGALERD